MAVVQRVSLLFREGTSDKQYDIQIEADGNGTFAVNAYYGRRGGNLKLAPQGSALDAAEAQKIFAATVKKKTAKGYKPDPASAPAIAAVCERNDTGMRPQLLNPIDADGASGLLQDDNYCLQMKYDGERLLVGKSGSSITPANRKGILTTIAGDLRDSLAAIEGDFEIDGENVDGVYHVFDVLWLPNVRIATQTYSQRYQKLSEVLEGCRPNIALVPNYLGTSAKSAAFATAREDRLEGVVFKDLRAPISVGRPNSGGTQLKFKFWESASAIVSGINTQNSIALEMIDSGLRVSVGNVTVKANQRTPAVGDVVEVKYLYMRNAGGSLYQPELIAVRSDIDPEECTIDQIKLRG